MPSKIQLDENLWFLFICLQKSDYKTIDFNAVGQATNLKSPAARMRFTRLRRQIEGGTMIGTHGTPLLGTFSKMSSAVGRNQECSHLPLRKVECDRAMADNTIVDPKNEIEIHEFSERNKIESFDSGDSEDEVPLAKRKHSQIKSSNGIWKGSGSRANPEQRPEYHENPDANSLSRLPTAPPRRAEDASHS